MRRVTLSLTRVRVRALLMVLAAAVLAVSCVLWLVVPPGQLAQAELLGPPTDLLALGLGIGQTPPAVAVQHNPEPPLEATPRAVCGPGSHPLGGHAGSRSGLCDQFADGANGYWCNLTLISHQGQSGGFKVLRYIDRAGARMRLLRHGAAVPDQRAAAVGPVARRRRARHVRLRTSRPDRDADLAADDVPARVAEPEPAPRAARRGARATPPPTPGLVSIYDVSADCRHPVLDSTALVARFGHEGAFSPDGNTFYAAGTAVQSITAIDVSDPTQPPSDLAGKRVLAWADDQRRRQPRVRRRSDQRPAADPRHERDPGAQAQPPGAGDQPADVGAGDDPAERDPDHDPRHSVPARVRRVRDPLRRADAAGHGRRRTPDRHLR